MKNNVVITEHEILMIPNGLLYEYDSRTAKIGGDVYECDGEPLRDHEYWSLHICEGHLPDGIMNAADIRAKVKVFTYSNPHFGPDMQTTETPVILSARDE